LVGWPVGIGALWYAAGRRNGRMAAALVFAVVVLAETLVYAGQVQFLNSYAADEVFLLAAVEQTPSGLPVLVKNDEHPLNSSWFLFYLHGRGRLLHNLTFLRGDDLVEPEVYVLCRTADHAALLLYGAVEMLAQSQHTRGEHSSDDRWALFRVRFHPGLKRLPAGLRISPAQAAGLEDGPYLR
jgi:hypothetical protein